jgi:hypothetical protein
MSNVTEVIPERSYEFIIDFSRLEQDFMPGFQKEKVGQELLKLIVAKMTITRGSLS